MEKIQYVNEINTLWCAVYIGGKPYFCNSVYNFVQVYANKYFSKNMHLRYFSYLTIFQFELPPPPPNTALPGTW